MSLRLCPSCGQHTLTRSCPHCGHRSGSSLRAPAILQLSVLLGVGTTTIAGCVGAKYGMPDTWTGPDTYSDVDNDGFTSEQDCDDDNAAAYPGAASAESSLCTIDSDGDGYGDASLAAPYEAGTDCDDADAAINPAATETPGDKVDSNCNDSDDD